MDNYKPALVVGSTFEKMRDKFEGKRFGPWDAKTFEVEDSAFGFVKMQNGATIFIEAAWALHVARSREGQVTLCGTEAGAELVGDGAAAANALRFLGIVLRQVNRLDAIINDTEPYFKPEQAFVVTQILDAAYKSAAEGRAIQL